MAFDPSIIMGYRGIGELPNPMNQLAQVSQIQAAQQQGQMNQMKIEEMLAERKEIDATAAALKDKGYTPQTYFEMMVSSRNPERQKVGAEGLFRLKRQADFQSQFGPALGKMFGEPTAAPAETPAAGTFAADTAARRTAMAPAAPVNAMAPASVNAMAPAPAAARQPASINQMEQMAMQLGQYEDVPGAKTVANLLEKKLEAARKITSGAPGHVLYQNGVAINTVPETTNPEIKLYEYAKNQGYGGTLFDFKRDMAVAGRAPVQPVAPTITQIVDPTNPNQMLTIDARRYQNGGVGSPGVIGVAGKEPSAALRINKVEQGKTQLQNDLDNLRSSFTELDRLRAIPSTERNVVSNLMSATQASGIGQALGRAGGSPEQVERDVINSARQRLVASIKNASGMSSKSLDSNMELQTMLRSISDPGQSVEAAMRIISDIEDAYVKGAGTMAKRDQTPAATQGTGGFKYLGKESK